MKRKIGLTATPMPKNWVRALYIIWKRKLRKVDHDLLIAFVAVVILILQMFIIVTAVNGQEKSKGLQIGEKVPDVVITNILNHPTGTAKISDFKGKLLILDFWATWCSPCVAMIPKMDALQNTFDDQVQFLSVTYQSEKEVAPFLKKLAAQKNIEVRLPQVTGDQALHKLFPHTTLPHYVWITPDGIVGAITGHREITQENVQKMLKEGRVAGQTKADEAPADYSREKPFLIAGNGGNGENLLYHSVFTGYTNGLNSGYSTFRPDSASGGRVTARNLAIPSLFRLAYSEGYKWFGYNRMRFNVRDTTKLISRSKGAEYRNWLSDGNGWCYELQVPKHLSVQLFPIMQQDLVRLFPDYEAKVVPQTTRCLVLTRTSDEDKIKTSGGTAEANFSAVGGRLRNSFLSRLVSQLDVIYLQRSPYPLVDGTGYKGRVDLDIDGSMTNVGALNKALAKYDLKFVEKDVEIEMLVISDRQ